MLLATSAQSTIPVMFNNETQLFRLIEQRLGHAFAMSLYQVPGGRIRSFPQSGCESLAGLFCLELFSKLNEQYSEVERMTILQENWQWIENTVRKVI